MSNQNRSRTRIRNAGKTAAEQERRVDEGSAPTLDPSVAFERARGSSPSALTPANLLALQRTAGNQAVRTLLSRRARAQSANEGNAADASGARNENGVAPGAEAAVDRASSSTGHPLPADIKSIFERSLSADLSDVRIHTGPESAEAADAVGAQAYALGPDIHFAAGYYAPADVHGAHLLAHEVAHTVQQHEATLEGEDTLEVSHPHDSAEVAADRAAAAMVHGVPTTVSDQPATQIQRSPLDSRMDEAEANYAKSMGNDEKVQAVGGHSLVGDKAEAEALTKTIDQQAEGLTAAAEETGNGDKYKNCLTENFQTKFLLQKYATAVTESSGSLETFQPAYQAARADYGRVYGLAAAFMGGKDTGDKGNIEAAASALPGGPGNPTSKRVEAMRGGDRVFSEDLKEFRDARNLLETDRSNITSGRLALNTAEQELKSTAFAIQAEVATVTADKKKAELAKVKSDIQEITATISKIYEVGEAVLTATQGLGVNVAGIENENWSDPSQLSKLKTGGQTVLKALGGPKKVIETAVTALNQGKMDGLQAQIDAANEENKLATASKQAAQLGAKKSRVTEVLGKLAEVMMAFDGHKQALESIGKKLAERAGKSGDPKMAPAIKFLTESDKFLAQVDITIQMGRKQQEAGREATKHRGDLNDDPSNPATPPSEGAVAVQKHWWRAQKVKGELNAVRRFFTLEKKPTYYYATRETVELKSQGRGSLQSGNDRNGAQFEIGKAVNELVEQSKQVKTLQVAAQNVLGVGAPVATGAVTAP